MDVSLKAAVTYEGFNGRQQACHSYPASFRVIDFVAFKARIWTFVMKHMIFHCLHVPRLPKLKYLSKEYTLLSVALTSQIAPHKQIPKLQPS